jgi:hypothetical protein
MRLISAGSLVRAQSGPPGTEVRRSLRNTQAELTIFEVWHEPENSDPTPDPQHAAFGVL